MKKITLGFVTVLFAAAVTLGSGTAVKAAEEETGVCEDIVVQDEIEAQEDIEVRDETKGDEFFAEPTVYCDTKEEAYAAVRSIIRNRINNMSVYGVENTRGYDENGYVYDRFYAKEGIFGVYSMNMLDVCDFEAEREGMEPYEGDYMYNLIGNRYKREFNYEGPRVIFPDDGSDGIRYRDGVCYETYEVYLPVITTLEEETEVDRKVEQLMNSTFASVRNGTNEQKIKAVYNYITKNVNGTVSGAGGSDRTYPLYHTAYHALIKGNGTCEAFAQLFTRLSRELGVPSKVIMGIDANNHTYNIVDKGDGYWYFIDTNTGRYLTDGSFSRAKEQERYASYRFIKNYWDKIKGGTNYKVDEIKVVKQGEIVYSSSDPQEIFEYIAGRLAENPSDHYVIRFDCDWRFENESDGFDFTIYNIPDYNGNDIKDNVSIDLGGHTLYCKNMTRFVCGTISDGTIQTGSAGRISVSGRTEIGVGTVKNINFTGTTGNDKVFFFPEFRNDFELDDVYFKKLTVSLSQSFGNDRYEYDIVITNDVTLENCRLYIMDRGNSGHAVITNKVCDASGKVLSAGQLVLKGTNTLGMKGDFNSLEKYEPDHLYAQKPIEFVTKNGGFTEGDVIVKSAATIKKYSDAGTVVKGDVWDIVDKDLTEANKDPADGSSLMAAGKGVAFGTRKKANPVKSVSLNKTSIKLGASTTDESRCDEFVLVATTLPVDADNGAVKFECDKPEYLRVTDNGDKTALIKPTGSFPAGKTSVTVTVTAVAKDGSGKNAKCKVTIGKVAESVTISASKGASAVAVGKTLKLTATVLPKEAINKEVIWDSSNREVATVDKKGNVKALSVGSTKITAKSSTNDSIGDVYEIKTYIPVKKVTLGEKSVSLHAGNSFLLTAAVSPENATLEGGSVTPEYKVISGDKYVSVDASGIVTAATELDGKAKQSAKILVTAVSDGNVKKTATCNVTVTAASVPVKSLKAGTKKLTMGVGDTAVVAMVVLPVTADNKELAWESDKPGVAAVDDKGNITAVSPGTAKITASSTDGSKKKVTVTITVR